MKELFVFILALGMAVVTNIALGMYFKIGKEKIAFSWKKLLDGVIKGVIVGGSFVSLAYIIELTGLVFDEAPMVILTAGIIIYYGKCIMQLKNILGIKAEDKG